MLVGSQERSVARRVATRSHARLLREFIRKAPPWTPFVDDAEELWIWTTSTLEDNPHIDRDAYRRKLVASTGGAQAPA